MGYMTEKEARSVLTDLGRRSYERAYVAANDGNISCRISADSCCRIFCGRMEIKYQGWLQSSGIKHRKLSC